MRGCCPKPTQLPFHPQDKKDVDFAYWPLNVGPKPGGSDDERLGCTGVPLISELVDFIVYTQVFHGVSLYYIVNL